MELYIYLFMARNFPTYKQLDTMDCGPSCLKIIARFYGKTLSLQSLKDKCHVSREGVSLLGISDAAEQLGFRTTAVKITFEQLCDLVQLPCIVHWEQNHFIVVYKIKKRRKSNIEIFVSDPAIGLVSYSREQFLRSWCQIVDGAESMGIALIIEPTPRFYETTNHENTTLSYNILLRYIKPYRSFIIQLLLAMASGSIISLIFPFLTQSVIDVGIGTSDLNFVIIILLAQVILTLGQMFNELIRGWLMLHITTRISISLISDFLIKLMRLPISFFDSKMIGDILQRIGDHNRVQAFLTGTLLSLVISIVTFIVYSAVMGGYNYRILIVFLLGALLYVGWVLLFLKQRRKLDYMSFKESSSNQSCLIQLITGMQDVKMNGCEKQKRWEWERIQARLFNISVKGLTLNQIQQVGGTFIDQLKNVFISFMAAQSVIEGAMTLGMMTAMQFILGQLNAPISQFIKFVQEAQDAKISLERLSEIHKKENEEEDEKQYIEEIPDNADIEFKNVSFQYNGPNSELVLSNINITIPFNKVTAIVGTSGSGKTTLLKMILGYYHPVRGDVLLGGNKISDYRLSCWRKNCSTVFQDGFIFSDSITRNIAVSEETADTIKLCKAMETANIYSFVNQLPLKGNTKIGADGNGISAGQKQRILIARAAYRNTRYLFLDEATNSLDAENEKMIMENLSNFFENKTVVIVAHRLSTVKNADNIIVLEKGKVVEQGNHKQLTEEKGYYYNLIKNQLELGN